MRLRNKTIFLLSNTWTPYRLLNMYVRYRISKCKLSLARGFNNFWSSQPNKDKKQILHRSKIGKRELGLDSTLLRTTVFQEVCTTQKTSRNYRFRHHQTKITIVNKSTSFILGLHLIDTVVKSCRR